MYDFFEIEKKLIKKLTNKRYRHSLSVAYMASSLAMCYEEAAEDAYLAGLLHDCAKCMKESEYLIKCSEYGILYTSYEEKNPSMLHAKVGAYLAEHEYGIKDKKILDAILYHIGGKPDMTFVEKAIYTADYIELWRSHLSELEFIKLRKTAFRDIDEAVYLIADNIKTYLEMNGFKMDDLSLQMWGFYRERQDYKGG